MGTVKSEMNLICFDLEGPLCPQDNAYELMKLFPRGGKIFEVISRYDDLLTLERRPDYEPGDTLALIVPFLAYHGTTEEQITAMGQKAALTPGAIDLTSRLKSRGWHMFCISTSYEQYAFPITGRLKILSDNVACTSFPLAQIRHLLSRDEFALLEQTENEIANLNPYSDDSKIKEYLDYFYWRKLPQTSSGRITSLVKPVGGRRKLEALENFSTRMGKPLSRWAAVGDSITDIKMLQAVNKAGGLAIAFNANEYALKHTTMSLASARLDDLWTILEVWEKDGRHAVEEVVKEKAGGVEDKEWFHWLDGTQDVKPALEIHQRIRRLVREEAAKLG
jgi:energy-converting hydrogenase A subunit R